MANGAAAVAGAESRVTLGIVIFSGVSFTTVMTGFVVPDFYRLLARNTRSRETVANELERLQQSQAPTSPRALTTSQRGRFGMACNPPTVYWSYATPG